MMSALSKSDPEIKRLKSMVGNTYLYHGNEKTITGYAASDHGEIQIKTEEATRPIITTKAKLAETLDNLLPVEQPDVPAAVNASATALFKKDASNLAAIESELMSQIDKIKEDPDNIDQAKAITKTADTIIKMNKQKIEMLREIRKTKSS